MPCTIHSFRPLHPTRQDRRMALVTPLVRRRRRTTTTTTIQRLRRGPILWKGQWYPTDTLSRRKYQRRDTHLTTPRAVCRHRIRRKDRVQSVANRRGGTGRGRPRREAQGRQGRRGGERKRGGGGWECRLTVLFGFRGERMECRLSIVFRQDTPMHTSVELHQCLSSTPERRGDGGRPQEMG